MCLKMIERSLYFNSNCLARFIGDIWKEGYEELDLSPAHASLILLVLEEPGIIQRDAATRLHLEKSTITRSVDKLITRNFLIRKDPESGNKKEKCIFPTNKSENIKKRIIEINAELEDKISNRLKEEQFERLHELVDKITNEIK
jgi:DNA-binding MarR family transcriptional regulator